MKIMIFFIDCVTWKGATIIEAVACPDHLLIQW